MEFSKFELELLKESVQVAIAKANKKGEDYNDKLELLAKVKKAIREKGAK